MSPRIEGHASVAITANRGLPVPTEPSLAWMDDALCAQVGYEIFFPEKSDHASAGKARSICAKCPVQTECLTYAVPQADLWGIWGGTTERERMAMRTEERAEREAAVTKRLRELGMVCAECADPTHAKGLCRRHYRQAKRAS